MVPACRPAGTPKAVPERDAEQSVTPDDVALLAHELRRRMAAMRMLGEAVSLLRSQDRDPSAMLERLMGELHDLDDLAAAVLGDVLYRRPADSAPGAEVVSVVRAAARTVAAAPRATVHVGAARPGAVQASASMLRPAAENQIANAVVHRGPDGGAGGVHLAPTAGPGGANPRPPHKSEPKVSDASASFLPAVEQPGDVVPLRLGEVHPVKQAARLERIVVRDCRFEVLAQRRRFAQLPAQPAEEAHACLIHHRAGRLQR